MRRFGLALVTCALALPVSQASDWSRFRGDNGSGISNDSVPTKWDATTARFDVKLPGQGNGSPIVVKGKVYLQTSSSDGDERGLACLDAVSGNLDWHTKLKGQSAHTHAKNSLASSTPACDGERIYCVFWDGADVFLHAFDLKGKPLWDKKLGGFKSQHGPGFSPVVVNGKVIVNYDQDSLAEIVAFDAKSGNKVWSASRKAFRACYSTPYLRPRTDGESGKDLVVSSTAGMTAYDPDSGQVRWDWSWPFDGMALRTVGSPIDAGKFVVAISGDGGGSRSTVVIDPTEKTPKKVWEKRKDTPYVPGPVAFNGTLYWITDTGMAMAVDAATGEERYKERALSGSVSASLIAVDGGAKEPLILAISEAGKAIFYKAKPNSFEKVAEHNLKDSVFATPAVADGHIFIRAGNRLVCYGKKGA